MTRERNKRKEEPAMYGREINALGLNI